MVKYCIKHEIYELWLCKHLLLSKILTKSSSMKCSIHTLHIFLLCKSQNIAYLHPMHFLCDSCHSYMLSFTLGSKHFNFEEVMKLKFDKMVYSSLIFYLTYVFSILTRNYKATNISLCTNCICICVKITIYIYI